MLLNQPHIFSLCCKLLLNPSELGFQLLLDCHPLKTLPSLFSQHFSLPGLTLS